MQDNDDYIISREDTGKQLLEDNNVIIEYLFGASMRQWWPTDSTENKSGIDFTTENGINVDMKNCIDKVHSKYQLSSERSIYKTGPWEDVLLAKKTDVWLHLIKTDDNTIEFFTLSRDNVAPLLEYCKLHGLLNPNMPARKCGGKWQRLIEFPLMSIPTSYITTYDKCWDIKQQCLVDNN